MKVGDLIKIVQSNRDTLHSHFNGLVGIIVRKTLGNDAVADWYDVLTRDRILYIRADYLEVINESR